MDCEPEDVLKLAVYAGEILIKSGAETARTEDTMSRIMAAHGATVTEPFVTPSVIICSINTENKGFVSLVRRITKRRTHFGKVAGVNDVSRDIVENGIDIETATKRLQEIEKMKSYPVPVRIFFAGVSCFSFCYLIGGSFFACFATFFISMLLYALVILMDNKSISGVIINVITGLLVSVLVAFLVGFFDNLHRFYDQILIGCMMPMVPGVSATNAMRDILDGDYISGVTRLSDAAVVAVGIAVGVVTGIKFVGFIETIF